MSPRPVDSFDAVETRLEIIERQIKVLTDLIQQNAIAIQQLSFRMDHSGNRSPAN